MKKASPVAADPGLPPGLRRYVYLTAALSGAAIMVVEILGAKLLAPYVGTSHFVWTAQIAVTLVALAAGYYLGGRQADRVARLSRLYLLLLGAAVYLALITLVLRPVASWCLRFPLALGSLAASGLLFFVPLALMAMTAPFLVRFLTSSVATVGGCVGRLTAISTVGSFLGTVLIGYVLIPFLPNPVTLLLTAGALAVLALGYLLTWGRREGPPVAALAAVGLGLVLGLAGVWRDGQPRYHRMTELYRANSNFGELQVLQDASGRERWYLNDLLVQNTYDPEAKAGLSAFTYMLEHLARAYSPSLRSALCIGLGVGIVPARLAQQGVEVEVVEINPRAAEVAARYFDCPLDSFRLVFGDGRQFINRSTNRYDAIVLDAFLGDSSPGHLMSQEAFAGMRALLRPEGVLVINAFADFHPGKDFYGASLDKTLKSVFRSVRIHATGSGNVYYVASDRSPMDVLHPPDFRDVPPSVRGRTERAFHAIMNAHPDHGMVLTDAYNPVEVFDAANREETRRSLARSVEEL